MLGRRLKRRAILRGLYRPRIGRQVFSIGIGKHSQRVQYASKVNLGVVSLKEVSSTSKPGKDIWIN